MKIFLTIIGLFFSVILFSQVNVYIAPGAMNYAGDLQRYSYTFDQSNFSFGAGVSAPIIKNVSVRADFLTGKVQADDKVFGKRRNLNFSSKITEGSLNIQYDFWDIFQLGFRPYIFGGVGVFHFDPYTYTADSVKVYLQPLGTEGQGLIEYPDRDFYKLTQLNNVIGGGVKYNFSDQFGLAFEVAYRILYTDYLDDVSTTYPKQDALLQARGQLAVDLSYRTPEVKPQFEYKDDGKRGGSGIKDNYYNTSIKFIFRLQPSSERRGGFKKNATGIDCPKNVF